MPLKNDVMIIIGSKTSANTKRLYQISKALNKKSYWIRSCAEVKSEWFKGAHTVGIMAGASTPDTTTKDIVALIRGL
jgi:4-hydroxy-3-methylbut-2-enyl diphosphate reductase